MSLPKPNRLLKLDVKSHPLWVTVVAVGGLLLSLHAAQAADPEPQQTWSPIMPAPMSDDDTGFKPIFDGKTLQGWDDDPAYWRVENQTIVGETTKKNSPNNYMIWQGGKPADFELKLDYRISAMGNSGVQYRSTEVPGVKGDLRGYQADIDGAGWGKWFFEEFGRSRGWNVKRVTGQIYDEGERTFLALPGQLSYVGNQKKQHVLASLGDGETLARTLSDDWNKLHLIVRGNQLIHIVNGRVMAMVIDDDTSNRRMEGLLALQVHGGDPMKVEFRNIRLKTL